MLTAWRAVAVHRWHLWKHKLEFPLTEGGRELTLREHVALFFYRPPPSHYDPPGSGLVKPDKVDYQEPINSDGLVKQWFVRQCAPQIDVPEGSLSVPAVSVRAAPGVPPRVRGLTAVFGSAG